MRTGRLRETAIEQCLPDRASGIEGFEIGDLPPALAVTAGEKHAIWRRRRPVLQALDQTVRIRAKLRRVADPQAAFSTGLEYRVSFFGAVDSTGQHHVDHPACTYEARYAHGAAAANE
jgi:hypothetical protein